MLNTCGSLPGGGSFGRRLARRGPIALAAIAVPVTQEYAAMNAIAQPLGFTIGNVISVIDHASLTGAEVPAPSITTPAASDRAETDNFIKRVILFSSLFFAHQAARTGCASCPVPCSHQDNRIVRKRCAV
jgi:hypothetical protein